MKSNLTRKLFLITLLCLFILMSFSFIFQLFFFQPFYEEKKKANLTTQLSRFRNLYSYQFSNSRQITDALKNFAISTSSKIAVYTSDNHGNYSIRFISDFYNSDDTDALEEVEAYFFNELLHDEDLLTDVTVNNTIRSTIFKNEKSGVSKIGVVGAISISSKNDSLVIAVAPLQPIEEAFNVIIEFYIYIFIGFMVIAILLSSVYSKFVSKPLVILNKTAQKMSKLDFSEKCNLNRNDEIGNLSNTLNFLSYNLQNALNELESKNNQLEADIEKERNLEKMRKDFIDSVSHELKTPIGIIEGYAEGIMDGIVTDEDAIIYLQTIIDESKKMGVLVSNMLELSKLEAGAVKPKLQLFNVNRLISKVVKTHITNASLNNLNIIFEQNTKYSYILADTFQMEQILTNLITNAIKYTPKGNNIIISISQEKDKYKLSVINEGTNIDCDDFNKLFDKFYRLDKARQRTTNSTGLGLSIVKNLLELNNFTFKFYNTDNAVEFDIYMDIQELDNTEE